MLCLHDELTAELPGELVQVPTPRGASWARTTVS